MVENLIGRKFDRLLPIEYVGKTSWGNARWLCKCDCGNENKGGQNFARDHGIDLEGEMTVEELIKLTKDAYGGEIIRLLEGENENA